MSNPERKLDELFKSLGFDVIQNAAAAQQIRLQQQAEASREQLLRNVTAERDQLYSQLADTKKRLDATARRLYEERSPTRRASDYTRCRIPECNQPAAPNTEDFCVIHYSNLMSWLEHRKKESTGCER